MLRWWDDLVIVGVLAAVDVRSPAWK